MLVSEAIRKRRSGIFKVSDGGRAERGLPVKQSFWIGVNGVSGMSKNIVLYISLTSNCFKKVRF